MTYNVDNFKVKKIENFEIPLEDIEASWYFGPEGMKSVEGVVKIPFLDVEWAEIHGIIADGVVKVVDIKYGMMSSGHRWGDFIKMLESSSGYLRALVVWESGDRVEWITVDNGEITREEI